MIHVSASVPRHAVRVFTVPGSSKGRAHLTAADLYRRAEGLPAGATVRTTTLAVAS